MKTHSILIFFFLFFATCALCLSETAEAARLGGGRSFGGKPFMSRPAPVPGMTRQTPSTQSAPSKGVPPTAMQRHGMGGLFGGLLAGTLIGSMLFGHGFAGGGFLDILIFGLLLYFCLKLFARARAKTADARQQKASAYAATSPSSMPQQNNVPTYGDAGWERLRDTGRDDAQADAGMPHGVPAGFNTEEFLRGAKMAYRRLQSAWDKRDLEDIAEFATPAVIAAVRGQMEEDPKPSTTELLLVNAYLLHIETDGNDERAEVFFDVLMRENQDQDAPSSTREVWHFVRTTENDAWKLDGIQQVA
ncbi:Tim44 domain-containing protein [Candidatus Desulfovibrio trichonymphae]|uniref:Tim44-like domain-containing protein n=1 Tax=Candidatus Desulfovibrio trichonymphae TaxID=1725232 RepID=A0A1J1DQZ0_9BACT|nr:TIM44-like domain-containing protein [Candidatus Desulfovibrio trichonymphae]BAV92242.1 conserved hypothetical protein [Candidatus Desulfovibrio trichonymphae]GHU95151.1 transport protein [Deltaproteobacteria bacterium]